MLRRDSRIGRRQGFGSTLKGGARAGNRVLVVSVVLGDASVGAVPAGRPGSSQGGIVVGKRHIPHAATRNRVKRRLRHLLQQRLDDMPQGTQVIVRALEGSVGLTSQQLGRHLDHLLASASQKAMGRQAQNSDVFVPGKVVSGSAHRQNMR